MTGRSWGLEHLVGGLPLLDPVTGEPGIRVRVLDTDGGLLRDEHVTASTAAFGVDADLPEDAALGVIEPT